MAQACCCVRCCPKVQRNVAFVVGLTSAIAALMLVSAAYERRYGNAGIEAKIGDATVLSTGSGFKGPFTDFSIWLFKNIQERRLWIGSAATAALTPVCCCWSYEACRAIP